MTDPQPPVPPVPPADGAPPPPAAPVPPAAPAAPAQQAAPAQPAYPAYGQPTAGYHAPPTNTMAVVAMVLSLAGLLTGITAIIGAILGHVSLGQIKRTGEGGRGFALTAIIAGWVITGIGIIIIIAVVAFYAWLFTTYGYTTYGY